jgi:hypothetical protein
MVHLHAAVTKVLLDSEAYVSTRESLIYQMIRPVAIRGDRHYKKKSV